MDAILSTAFLAIKTSWKEVLQEEFESPYFTELIKFLEREISAGQIIFPPADQWFAAFNLTSFEEVKVVIIGQDPYHGSGQANGLCFSVAPGVRIPPSLSNVFKELQLDLAIPRPLSGSLEPWAHQGVLLLNATLTVRSGEAGSHQKQGWETFTDAVIRKLNDRREGIVFLLWGNNAKEKAAMIDTTRHFVLTAAHPSPLARNAFSGCGHFSRTNDLLSAMNKSSVDWRLQ